MDYKDYLQQKNNKPTIDFILPIYNEEKILQKNMEEVCEFLGKQNFDWQTTLAINGSTDNSLKIASELANKYKQINIKRLDKAGKGRAVRETILQSPADYAIYMDIDLAVSLDNIHDLVREIETGADLIIGSRLLPDSQIERSWGRELNSQGYNLLSRLILNHNFADLQCGFKAVRVDKFKQIASHIRSNRWFFDTELIIFAHHFGFNIKEVPVNWEENRYDQRKSKVKVIRDGCRFFKNLIKLRSRLKTTEIIV